MKSCSATRGDKTSRNSRENKGLSRRRVLSGREFDLSRTRGAAGDVLSHFIDKKGDPVSPDMERRLVSPSPAAECVTAAERGRRESRLTISAFAPIIIVSANAGGAQGTKRLRPARPHSSERSVSMDSSDHCRSTIGETTDPIGGTGALSVETRP